MLRSFYLSVLRLHPPAFRERFADEMLSIFDHAAGTQAALRLLFDALLSLARQWTLRPEFWHDLPQAPSQPTPDGIPSFQSLDPFRPRTAAVIHALVLSTAVFSVTCFAIRYSWIHVLHVHIPEVQWERPRPMQSGSDTAASLSPDDPGTPVQQRQSLAAFPAVPGPRFSKVSRKATAPLAMQKAAAGPSTQPGSGTSGSATPVPAPPGSEGSATLLAALPPQAYEGTYVSLPPDRLTISITADGGRLKMEIAGDKAGEKNDTLAAVSEMKFVVKGGLNCWIEFVPDRGGVIRQLTLFRNGREIIAQRR